MPGAATGPDCKSEKVGSTPTLTSKYAYRNPHRGRWRGKGCFWCEQELNKHSKIRFPTKDHVYPKSKGGKWVEWACYRCNRVKADKTPEEWEQYMDEHPYWWVDDYTAFFKKAVAEVARGIKAVEIDAEISIIVAELLP